MVDLVEGGFPDPLEDAVYALDDGTIGHGIPPDFTPEQVAQLRAVIDQVTAESRESHEHPERFVIFVGTHAREHHRRGHTGCIQGRCRGTTEPLPECPLCFAGRVHRPAEDGAPGRCDACDKPVLTPST